MFMTSLVAMVSRDVLVPRFLELYKLKMYSFLDVSHTSVKRSNKKRYNAYHFLSSHYILFTLYKLSLIFLSNLGRLCTASVI